jgi:hypothetical protein
VGRMRHRTTKIIQKSRKGLLTHIAFDFFQITLSASLITWDKEFARIQRRTAWGVHEGRRWPHADSLAGGYP